MAAAVVPDADALARAWAALDAVPDPEVPVISVRDLGIVRDLRARPDGGIEAVLTPTYSGCPATEVIADAVRQALEAAGWATVRVTQQLAPAWTTDWISDAGREKLRAYGIAPPEPGACGPAPGPDRKPIAIRPRALACPRCGSTDTERLSAFGSTACKALHRCRACREPFEHFKPI